jgi:hypothetical protein
MRGATIHADRSVSVSQPLFELGPTQELVDATKLPSFCGPLPVSRSIKSCSLISLLRRSQKRQIDVEIAELRAMDSETEPASSKTATVPTKRSKRKMSRPTRNALRPRAQSLRTFKLSRTTLYRALA